MKIEHTTDMAPLLTPNLRRLSRRNTTTKTKYCRIALFLVTCCLVILRRRATLSISNTVALPSSGLFHAIRVEDSKIRLSIADDLQASPTHLQPNSSAPTSRVDYPNFPVKQDDALSSAAPWPPYSTVLRIAGSKRRVVIVLANCGFLDVADNLIGSMLKLNMTNFVLIPLDNTSSHVLGQIYPNNTIPPNPDIGFADEEAQSFGSGSFRSLNAVRPLFIRLFLEAGFSVLYSDVDMYWRSNVLQLMQDELVNTDSEAVLQSDFGAGICSCLIYVKPTNNTIEIMKVWEERLPRGALDQREWNGVLQLKKSLGQIKYAIVNRTHGFPSGIEYFKMMNGTERDHAQIFAHFPAR